MSTFWSTTHSSVFIGGAAELDSIRLVPSLWSESRLELDHIGIVGVGVGVRWGGGGGGVRNKGGPPPGNFFGVKNQKT